ncbi:MAG: hypothetical protein MUF15_04870 [Acidobacteria bacterium]|jgi:hypothetical protein|nr:hypothetical protein [Acidobacteriota bacterium]
MKRTIVLIAMSILVLLSICVPQQGQLEPCTSTKYQALAVNKIVVGNPTAGIVLFEVIELDTKCYKDLRIFVHVMNDSYQTKPFTGVSSMNIFAYHAIGSGSWSYYSEKFPMKLTSEFAGYCQIPVIGEKTRIVILGYNMPDVKLKVDVAAYLLK